MHTPLDFFNKNNLLEALRVFEKNVDHYLSDEATLRAILFIYGSIGPNERIPHILHLIPSEIRTLIKDIEAEYKNGL